ncbi:M15 family metallopeptidase [uncultured Robinsoniella sp.]|uniref:M15 family metallopeptidase n=1 Tax=Robinsoniella sp. TaxID=2496533 RepID=UPI00374F9269
MKMDRQDRKTIRYRRLLIYTFLLVMVFMYISTKISMQKEKEALLEVRETSEVETEMNQGANTQIGTEPKETAGSRTKDSGKNAGMDTGTDTGTVTETDTTGFQIEEEDLWSLVLTNDKYPVPDGYEFREVSIPDTDQTIDNRVLEPLMKMLDGAKKEGMNLIVCSGARSFEKQEQLFQQKKQYYIDSGKTEEEAYNLAKRVISVPGSGEHVMGLAADIYSRDYKALDEGFADTPEGKWLRKNSCKYGFILRYDKGKEAVTGIDYEPWHFRYVGKKAAKYLKKHKLSLEEFYVQEGLYG